MNNETYTLNRYAHVGEFLFSFLGTYEASGILVEIEASISRLRFPEGSTFASSLGTQPVDFDLRYPDRYNCKGRMYLVSDSSSDTLVWGSFLYATDCSLHFEGTLAEFPGRYQGGEQPVQPIAPVEEPSVTPYQTDQVRLFNLAYSGLYQFSGLKRPGLFPVGREAVFISLRNDSDFFLAVEAEAAAGNLNGLVTLAEDYLAEEVPWAEALLQVPVSVNPARLWKGQEEAGGSAWEALVGNLPGEILLPESVSGRLWELLQNRYTARMILLENGAEEVLQLEWLTLLLRLFNAVLRGEKCAKAWLKRAVVMLPEEVFTFLAGASPEPKSAGSGPEVIGIGVLMEVQSRLRAYLPGELAHIENVMPFEHKMRQRKDRQESEEVDSRWRSETTGTTHEWDQERSARTRSEQDSVSASDTGSVTAQDGTGISEDYTATSRQVTFSGGYDLGFSGTENLDQQAKAFAGEAVARLWKNSQEQTRMLKRKVLRQVKESLFRQGFHNEQNEKPLRGMYRWVDKLLETRLVVQGERLVLEFLVIEPGKGVPKGLEPLLPGADPGRLAFWLQPDKMNWAGYLDLAAALDVSDLITCPPELVEVAVQLTSSPRVGALSVPIPEGYACKSALVSVTWEGGDWVGYVGSKLFSPETGSSSISDANPSEPPVLQHFSTELEVADGTGSLPVSLVTDARSYVCNVQLVCERLPRLMKRWQTEAYNQLRAVFLKTMGSPVHQKALRDLYRKQQAAIRRILQARCSKQLLESVHPDPESPTSSALEWVRRAFMWSEMVWEVLPEKGTVSRDSIFSWLAETQSEYQNPHLNAFLRAAQVQVRVAVEQGFEQAVLYAVWNQGRTWPGLATDAPLLESQRFYAWELLFHPHRYHRLLGSLESTVLPTEMIFLQENDQLPEFPFHPPSNNP